MPVKRDLVPLAVQIAAANIESRTLPFREDEPEYEKALCKATAIGLRAALNAASDVHKITAPVVVSKKARRRR